MQSMGGAVPSDHELALAARLRQSLQGCTQHIHGPVAAFGEIRTQAATYGVRVLVVRYLVAHAARERIQALVAAGVGRTDPRYRKEVAVAEFSNALLGGAHMQIVSVSRVDRLRADLDPYEQAVAQHSLWSAITTPAALRVFMEHHVYCVWDFMTLLKRLQRDLTGLSLPWQPEGSATARRLINEIVTGEESDQLPDGTVLSHYELYLQAMADVGADTDRVEHFRQSIPSGGYLQALGQEIERAARQTNVPPAAAAFLATTFRHVAAPLPAVVAAFALGREQVIPAMFRGTVAAVKAAGLSCETFEVYLDRHIEVDGDEHGPMALALLSELCKSEHHWQMATDAAIEALEARKTLWDAIEQAIRDLSHGGYDSDGDAN